MCGSGGDLYFIEHISGRRIKKMAKKIIQFPAIESATQAVWSKPVPINNSTCKTPQHYQVYCAWRDVRNMGVGCTMLTGDALGYLK